LKSPEEFLGDFQEKVKLQMLGWSCNACTFRNEDYSRSCEMCGSQKDGKSNTFQSDLQRAFAASLEETSSAQNEEALIEKWIKESGLNEFGDPADTFYIGGSPLFNEKTFELIERMDYICSKHPDRPWMQPCGKSEQMEGAPVDDQQSEIEPDVKLGNQQTNLDDAFFSETSANLEPPNCKPNISMESDDWDASAKVGDDDWDEDDDMENWVDDDVDKPDLNVKTLNQVQWQCVKCAGFNGQFTLQCLICSESKNPTVHCDICDVPVPFMCYEPHMKSHEKCGHKSPVGVAFSIVSILRNQTSGIPTSVCWDFALAFVRKFFQIASSRGIELARPKIVYHWTPEKNINLIVDGNLKVPDGRNVLHQTDEGYYGKGVYTSPSADYARSYGHGAKKTIMCLAICGNRYVASYPQMLGKPLKEGFDMHVSNDRNQMEWVFFNKDQLLPAFVIEPSRVKQVQGVIDNVTRELCTAYRELRYFHGSAEEEVAGVV